MGETSDQQSPASRPDTPATAQPPPGKVRWTHEQPPGRVRWTHEQPPVKVRWTHQPPAGQPGTAPTGSPGAPSAGQPGTPPVSEPGTPSAGQPVLPPLSEPGVPLVARPGPPLVGEPDTPAVGKAATRVTGRRIVQYILDGFISSIPAGAITGLLSLAYNVRLVLATLLVLFAWYAWYWVYRPYRANGQTFGMQWLRVRVISQDGGRAGMKQLFVRWALLVFDGFALGLVGFFAIIFSRDRQRIGDRVAGTLVVRAAVQPVPPPASYPGAGWERLR
jgi:uncharacterized RDD family membrane protein YckC